MLGTLDKRDGRRPACRLPGSACEPRGRRETPPKEDARTGSRRSFGAPLLLEPRLRRAEAICLASLSSDPTPNRPKGNRPAGRTLAELARTPCHRPVRFVPTGRL